MKWNSSGRAQKNPKPGPVDNNGDSMCLHCSWIGRIQTVGEVLANARACGELPPKPDAGTIDAMYPGWREATPPTTATGLLALAERWEKDATHALYLQQEITLKTCAAELRAAIAAITTQHHLDATTLSSAQPAAPKP